MEEAAKAFADIKVGLPREEDTQMGSQINGRQLEKILAYIEVAKVAVGVERINGKLGKGAFMRPTLLRDVTNDMRVARSVETGRM